MRAEFSPEFWGGRRVFLTGHTGFKGSWLALCLQAAGAEVAGYALAPGSQPNMFDAAEVASGMRSQIGDLREGKELAAAVRAHRPSVVFHLAAQALVRASYRDPVETYATNVLGTVHLLEAVRHCPEAKAAVVVTSDKCYENREWDWGYRELDPVGGHDPYSSSKACAELVTAAYRDSFFGGGSGRAAVATARAGNVFGGGDWAAERLIPDAVRAFRAQRALEVRHPEAIRPWQHVLEPVGGYLRLAQRLVVEGQRYGGAWNFGPDPEDEVPVGAVLDQLARLWGRPRPAWRHVPDSALREAGCLRLDCSKSRARLDWTPTWSLQRGLEATVSWYQAWARGDQLRPLTLQQIDDFRRAPVTGGVGADGGAKAAGGC